MEARLVTMESTARATDRAEKRDKARLACLTATPRLLRKYVALRYPDLATSLQPGAAWEARDDDSRHHDTYLKLHAPWSNSDADVASWLRAAKADYEASIAGSGVHGMYGPPGSFQGFLAAWAAEADPAHPTRWDIQNVVSWRWYLIEKRYGVYLAWLAEATRRRRNRAHALLFLLRNHTITEAHAPRDLYSNIAPFL